MYTYRLGDVVIGSDMLLAGLPQAKELCPDWHITFEHGSPNRVSSPPYHTWYGVDGRPTARFVLEPPRRVISFRGGTRFAIDRDRRLIACSVRAGTLAAAAPLLLHQVLPLVLGLDRLVLHASAVRIGTGAIAFVGPSGSGKSTLACQLARRGPALVTDDILIVDTSQDFAMAIPVDVPMRLWPESIDVVTDLRAADLPRVGRRTSKRLVSASHAGVTYCDAPLRLERLFLLDQAEMGAPAITGIAKRDAAAALLARSFSLATDDPHAAGRLVDRIARVLAHASVWRLRVPGNFTALDELLDSVLAV